MAIEKTLGIKIALKKIEMTITNEQVAFSGKTRRAWE